MSFNIGDKVYLKEDTETLAGVKFSKNDKLTIVDYSVYSHDLFNCKREDGAVIVTGSNDLQSEKPFEACMNPPIEPDAEHKEDYFPGYTFMPTDSGKFVVATPSAEPVTPTQRWIPVSEGLPKKNGWYQCTVILDNLSLVMELFYKNGKWLDNRRIDMFNLYDIYGYGNTKEKHKLSYQELISEFEWDQVVIAWQPLPQPYEEKIEQQQTTQEILSYIETGITATGQSNSYCVGFCNALVWLKACITHEEPQFFEDVNSMNKLEKIEQIIKRTEGTLGLDNYAVQQVKEVLNEEE